VLLECSGVLVTAFHHRNLPFTNVVLLLALDFVSWFSLPSIQQNLCSWFGGRKELERRKICFSAKISVREGVV